MTGPQLDDGAWGDDDRRPVGTPVFSVREGVLPLPGPRATNRTTRRVERRGRAWEDAGEAGVEDMEDVA